MSRTPPPARPVPPACGVVPPYLLRHLAEATGRSGGEAGPAERTLVVDEQLRSRRAARAVTAPGPAASPGPDWLVHDAEGGTTLPGRPVRAAGEPPVGDTAVEEAATGITAALALLLEEWGRDSYDGAGRTVSASVHYGQQYANAFWDGVQLVFGDGDGMVFERFTRSVDVLAHELGHAVVERTAGLLYQGQSGALNESFCDVMGSCVKQRVLGQQAAEADWLVGAELFSAGVQARGLRDLAAPGTAYDDPRLGRDPQPAHLDDYVETTDDNGGVHLNSGIPNRAFHLAATALGGTSWAGAGRIWFAALTGGAVPPDADFATFARATVAAAGPDAAAVREAWQQVGVVVEESTAQSDTPGAPVAPAAATGEVRVRRSGGIVGRAVEAQVRLDDEQALAQLPELPALVERACRTQAWQSPPAPRPVADGFSYEFELEGQVQQLPEAALNPELRRIAQLLLGEGGA
ncbi:protealysin inhibitor emfourin [Nocardioides nanhaiensis]|uniref:Neutral metalloproteinase n=1 Tax=Nocardioides nanhaiensis TaxID=1476871 RepID=A0ABP8VXI0_9ACTN